MAKVSLILPVFNVEDYLVECMESVVNQTLKDLEIICINDGSTDGSLKILQDYAAKDERIIIVDKENGGYGIGMNIGLDRATGEYIGIVEPDDYVDLHMYEDLYELASKYDLDLIKADFYRFVHENGERILEYNHLSKNGKGYNKVLNPYDNIQIFRFIMNTWSGIYKRAFLEEYHIRHQETPGASFQDNGFWFKTFCYAKRVYFVDKPYYMNRRDNPNSSVKNKAKVYCMNDEYKYIHAFLDENPDFKKRFIDIYSVKRWHNYMWTYGRIADEFKLDYCKEISDEFKTAMAADELHENFFTALEWEGINRLIEDPVEFHYWKKYCVDPGDSSRKKIQKLEKEVKDLRTSNSFKVGRAVTLIPRKLLGRGK